MRHIYSRRIGQAEEMIYTCLADIMRERGHSDGQRHKTSEVFKNLGGLSD
ncbi:Uncharacterized protein dnm_024820 [Desulfonema magnum]|uniref:Uncharacterized protein n=1 Tax=Desulfonema magnum TaxID=45655 RepID=A0A975GMA0_9BACT|nr:Uncharacterized protein dnm_024820 [Desulfonema magnum]